jgi:glycosyltransferase involved in cell wall biosynthesis
MISVIVPTYNRTRLLMDRCIPSVLAQTDPDWECHVVGDGTDLVTVVEMARLCLADSRFRFTNLPHTKYPDDPRDAWGLLGLVPLNYGLDHAEGDWIAVLADDDEWTPDHNAVLLDAALATDAEHVYGVSETFKGDPPININQRYGAWPPGDAAFCNGANLYRASLPYRYALDCQSRGRTGDADLWIRMVEGGARFHFIDKVVHHYYRSWP